MFAYDVHFAVTHTKALDGDTGEIILKFPRSVVIYPEGIRAVPDHLQCRIIFQDNSEHIYTIPTVKVQSYSLEEIREKHLILFLPYTMLRFRSRLRRKKKITEKELTGYLEEVILILEEEVSAGDLTELQYHDYVRLIRHAAERVFAKHRKMWKEADKMTKPLIKLPSVEIRELKEELAEKEAELAEYRKMREETDKMTKPLIKLPSVEIRELKEELAEQKEENAEQKAKIAKQETEIAKQETEIAKQAAEIAKQKAENQRLQEMLRLAGTN